MFHKVRAPVLGNLCPCKIQTVGEKSMKIVFTGVSTAVSFSPLNYAQDTG